MARRVGSASAPNVELRLSSERAGFRNHIVRYAFVGSCVNADGRQDAVLATVVDPFNHAICAANIVTAMTAVSRVSPALAVNAVMAAPM
jgi:hypothetical protein